MRTTARTPARRCSILALVKLTPNPGAESMIERPCRNRSSRIPVVVGQGIQHGVQTLWDRADENLAVGGRGDVLDRAPPSHVRLSESRCHTAENAATYQ